MALTRPRRRGKGLAELSEAEIREKVASARNELRAIDRANPAEVVRQGRAAGTLKRMDKLLEVVETGQRELAARKQEAVVAAMPAVRGFQEDERAKKERRKELVAALSALTFVVARRHPELEGEQLVADRLDESERAELVELVAKARRHVYDDGPELDENETGRYETLVGICAGNERVFAEKREHAEARVRVREAAERVKVATLPRRPKLAEPGSIEIPRRFVFTWLKNETSGDRWSVMDVGTLAVLLACFANKDASVVDNARFQEEDGQPIVLVQGGIGADLRFAHGIGGSPVSDLDSPGHVRLGATLARLVANEWFTIQRTAVETRIGLGKRAKKALGQTD